MRYVRYIIRLVMVVAAVATFYVGVVQGEWGETMFNATLL
jgi:hypothetical protein